MKWFEVKERSAGRKRLLLTYYAYLYLGRASVDVIAFCVALITFLSASDLRSCCEKYLRIVGEKPSVKNIFRLFLNYANAQIDKIEVFAGKYEVNKISVNGDVEGYYDCIKLKKGAIFIFSHIGNIEIMRALLDKDEVHVSIFMSKEQTQTFRSFLNEISVNKNFSIYSTEEIGIETAIELQQKLDDGEFVFLAGDRLSKNSQNRKVEVSFLDKKIDLPYGTFKFAELLNADIFFISALKQKEKYNVILEKFEKFERCADKMASKFANFMTKTVKTAPFQFYHFYDFFKD